MGHVPSGFCKVALAANKFWIRLHIFTNYIIIHGFSLRIMGSLSQRNWLQSTKLNKNVSVYVRSEYERKWGQRKLDQRKKSFYRKEEKKQPSCLDAFCLMWKSNLCFVLLFHEDICRCRLKTIINKHVEPICGKASLSCLTFQWSSSLLGLGGSQFNVKFCVTWNINSCTPSCTK